MNQSMLLFQEQTHKTDMQAEETEEIAKNNTRKFYSATHR